MITSGTDTANSPYDPPAGFEGKPIHSNTPWPTMRMPHSAAANRTATVSLTVGGMIRFVNNNAASCTVERLLMFFKPV